MNFQRIQYPAVGFRVEVRDPGHPSNNDTSKRNGDMLPRDGWRSLDAAAFRDHLTWERRRGPLISFTRSWARALRRRHYYIHAEGARDVVVIAVWLKGLALYDAFDVAQQLNLDYDEVGKHLDEVLLHGCVYVDEYRILATFCGLQQTEEVDLAFEITENEIQTEEDEVLLPRITMRLQVPPAPTGPRQGTAERLWYEIYSHTGVRDLAKYLHLALSIGNQRYSVREDGKFRLHFV